VTTEQQAIWLNAVPLLALGVVYLAAGASLLPALLGPRHNAVRELQLAPALVFVCGGAAAVVFGLLVLRDREPVGGSGWPGLAAILLALVPALVFFARFSERTRLLTGPPGLARTAGRLRDADTIARASRDLVERAASVARTEFAAFVLIEEGGAEAHGVVAIDRGEEVAWFPDVRLDLRNEPSGVASAYHDAAAFAVYDARASQRVSARLVEATGARSVAYIPLIADQRVIGVLVVAATTKQRAFPSDDFVELQALAAEAAPVLDRLRATDDDRESMIAQIAARLRSASDFDEVLRDAVAAVAAALHVERCFVRLGEPDGAMTVKAQWYDEGLEPIGDSSLARLAVSNLAMRDRRTIALADVATAPELEDAHGGRRGLLELGSRAVLATPIVVFDRLIGVLAVHRNLPGAWPAADVAFVEAVARELGLGLDTARLLADHELRLQRQTALLQAAQTLTSELELQGVLEVLVNEVVQLLGADAADCWLFDEQRRTLECRAVHGLPESETGREIAPEGTLGQAIAARRPVLKRDFARTEKPSPSASYREFEDVMIAPIAVFDEVRGVLGVCSRTAGHFDEQGLELLEAFAALASLALRNAEAFEESSRQARIQRGFYRIASVLVEPLSLSATLDAVAQAACEAFGAAFAGVVMPNGGALRLAGGHDLPAPLVAALEGGLGDEPGFRHASEERRILASPQLATDDRFADGWRTLAEECAFRSLLLIPLEVAGEDAVGLVLVFFADERSLRDEDIELARHLAGAARGALERSGLFEGERTSRALAQQLARTGSALATELDPAAVLDEVVQQAPELLGADACAIRIVDGDELLVTAVAGSDAEVALGVRSETAGWLSGEVSQSRRAVSVEDASSDSALLASDAVLAAGYTAYLGVPLVGPESSLLGVISVYSRGPRRWRPEEVEALLALAANTSAALSNAELYQRVALEKERSSAILENIADGIVALDRDGNVVLWNRAAEQVTGVPAGEALGRSPQQVLGRTLSGAPRVPLARGGGEIWLSVNEAVMRDPAGQVAGRIYAFRDISADRFVEEMKSEFVSTVSHELRGPLTSIYGFAETLLREDILFGEEERRVFLGYISSESERLTGIVDQLLNVARLDTGDLHVNLLPTDVRPLVAEVVTFAEENVGHSFVLELPTEPLAAEADADKLRQVLVHLVDNAVKYSPNGGRVTVAARRKSDTVEFQVADEGLGIPESEHDRIFRKFYRADQERGGTGLGLFLAQGLVNAMGGRIWVESSEGEGSRFAFELPAARV
jgi:two-component system phosphate regulon sensor histidine kinase PhoR